MIYFADHHWWTWHKDRKKFIEHPATKVSIQNTGAMVDDADVHMLRNGGTEGISADPKAIRTGQNGGYQAINIAILAGASRILLIGYDMKYTGGRSHWHGDHPVTVPEAWYSSYKKHFERLAKAPPVPIINCTLDTAIEGFPRGEIEEVLQ